MSPPVGIDSLRTKYPPSDAATTCPTYGHQTFLHSHTSAVERDGEVLHLEIVPLRYGGYYAAAIDRIAAAPSDQRDCLSLPLEYGFVKVDAADVLYDVAADGMMETEDELFGGDDEFTETARERWRQGIRDAGITMPGAPGRRDGAPALAAYFVYHPYKFVDFQRWEGKQRPIQFPLADRFPSAMVGLAQMLRLGFTLDFAPQHPYHAQALCVRDRRILLVATYPRYIGEDDEELRSWIFAFDQFLQHFFYWRCPEACPREVRAALKQARACATTQDLFQTVMAYFRPRLVREAP